MQTTVSCKYYAAFKELFQKVHTYINNTDELLSGSVHPLFWVVPIIKQCELGP